MPLYNARDTEKWRRVHSVFSELFRTEILSKERKELNSMILADYLNSQFSFWQDIEFFARLVVACACGALIGVERSRRFKEAGIRTHIIVCCASALMMIVSKYGFADLTDAADVMFNGTKGADPARIAAQVVSGISFLGAGVIFKHGSSVKGLTTAAGLWATSGIGLAIGSGMYILGIFTTALVTILQIVMHKFVVGADTLSVCRLSFTVRNSDQLRLAWDDFIHQHRMQIIECNIKYHENGNVSYEVTVRTMHEVTVQELDTFLQEYGEVWDVSCSSLG